MARSKELFLIHLVLLVTIGLGVGSVDIFENDMIQTAYVESGGYITIWGYHCTSVRKSFFSLEGALNGCRKGQECHYVDDKSCDGAGAFDTCKRVLNETAAGESPSKTPNYCVYHKQSVRMFWGAWSTCSTTCGSGNESRKRTCKPLHKRNFKKRPPLNMQTTSCPGKDTERRQCNRGHCVGVTDHVATSTGTTGHVVVHAADANDSLTMATYHANMQKWHEKHATYPPAGPHVSVHGISNNTPAIDHSATSKDNLTMIRHDTYPPRSLNVSAHAISNSLWISNIYIVIGVCTAATVASIIVATVVIIKKMNVADRWKRWSMGSDSPGYELAVSVTQNKTPGANLDGTGQLIAESEILTLPKPYRIEEIDFQSSRGQFHATQVQIVDVKTIQFQSTVQQSGSGTCQVSNQNPSEIDVEHIDIIKNIYYE